jgi:putative transposase
LADICWEGRCRAAPIDSDAYFLACCRYIELNPVRAGVARRPATTAGRAGMRMRMARSTSWSKIIPSIVSSAEPEQSDRSNIAQAFVEALREATNGGWALGDARFKRRTAKAAGRRATPSAGSSRRSETRSYNIFRIEERDLSY